MRSPGYYWWALRRDARRGWKASWAAHRLAPRIWAWRNPHAAQPPAAVPVHLLCGHDQAALAAWMLASWHARTARNWRVVVHDDGTLTPADAAALRRLSPTLEVMARAVADAAVAPRLAAYPACARYRGEHALALKIFDVPLLAASPRLLLLDSDVLFFAPPAEILAWVDRPDDHACWFNADVNEAATITPAEARTKFDCELWARVNSGVCLLDRAAIDLAVCERALRETGIRAGHVWRIEQTLYALCASRHGRGGLLPAGYEVSLGAHRRPGAIARHYVGAVRDRFWGEGVWELAAQLIPS